MAGWKVGSMLAAALAVVIASSGLVAAPQKAEAAITGTAGLYVPSQGRIVDTRNGTGGYSTPFTANATRLVQVTGTQSVPASTVTAVQVVVTAVDPTVQGVLSGGASGGSTSALMVYDGGRGGITSNSAILPVGADGKIQLTTQSTTHVVVDVQGYYTSGNGVTAPGGYHPVDGSRIVDTRTGTGAPISQVATGQTLTVQATGVGGVPAGASAVYVNVMVRNYGAGAFLTPYAADQVRPNVALNFPATSTQAIPLGAQIALSSSGAFKLFLGGASTSVDLFIDIEGYFTPGDSDGAFTPATGRILDTRVAPATAVGPDKTISIPVAGQAGLPSVADDLEAAVLNVTALDGQAGGGFARLWPSDKAEPNPFHNINYSNSTQTNLVTVPIGADGAIKLHNVSGDTVHFVLDIEGFYSPLAPNISCPSPFRDGSWTTALPAAPIACRVASAGTAGKNLMVALDGVEGAPLAMGLESTSVNVDVSPSAGIHLIEARVISANGDVESKSQYELSFGDWAKSPIAGYPQADLVTQTLSPALMVNSDGDKFSPDVLIRYTVSLNPDGTSQPVVTSEWVPGEFRVPDGVLAEGVRYFWSATVKGLSGGRSAIDTVHSGVWSFVASSNGPVDPSSSTVDAVTASPTVEDLQARADRGETPLTLSETAPGTSAPSPGVTPLSGGGINITCTGKLQYPHLSASLKKFGIRSVDNKIDISCTGYGAASVQVRVRGIISFAPAVSATDTKNKVYQLRASTSETKTLTVNGKKVEFTCPSTGRAGAGLGKGFWATTFTYQPSAGRYVGTVGTQTSTHFLDLR